MAYYITDSGTPIHVLDEQDVEFTDPDAREPYWEPVGPTLCDADVDDEAAPMETVAPGISEYIQRGESMVCPGCVLALLERHNLPDALLSDEMAERIEDWSARQRAEASGAIGDTHTGLDIEFDQPEHHTPGSSRVVPPGTGQDGIKETAERLIADREAADLDTSCLSLRLSPDLREALDSARIDILRAPDAELTEEPSAPVSDSEAGSFDENIVSVDIEPLPRVVDADDVTPTLAESEDILDMDIDALDEAVRASSDFDGKHPPKYVPPDAHPAPVHGQWPGVAGITYRGEVYCLDCGMTDGLVDFGPEPAAEGVALVLRDAEWDRRPYCGECDRPIDVPVVASESFEGTCVQTDSAVVLDDGENIVTVTDTTTLPEEPRLGAMYEVPLRHCDGRPREPRD